MAFSANCQGEKRKGNNLLIELRRTRAQGRCPRPHKAVVAPEHGRGSRWRKERSCAIESPRVLLWKAGESPSGKSFPADAGCGHLPYARVKHELSTD